MAVRANRRRERLAIVTFRSISDAGLSWTFVCAAMNGHLALKFGDLWRLSNRPAQGFARSDSMGAASQVVRWRAAPAAP
jgi:hypothetical protein